MTDSKPPLTDFVRRIERARHDIDSAVSELEEAASRLESVRDLVGAPEPMIDEIGRLLTLVQIESVVAPKTVADFAERLEEILAEWR